MELELKATGRQSGPGSEPSQVVDDRRELDKEKSAVEERANHQRDAAPHRGANLGGEQRRVDPQDL